MTASPAAPIDKKALGLSYGSALLGLGLMDAYIFVIPLWAVLIGANATEVGLLVGVRSLLPGLFAIHGGVLMDRYGPKRVMSVFVLIVVVMAPLYPLLPWIVPLMVLQTVVGLALSLQWIGAQTTIAHLSKGDTTYLGRFAFASRIGTFTAPVIFGALWDLTNPTVCFLGISLWAVVMLLLTRAIPIETNIPKPAAGATASFGATLRAVLPKWSDYRDTFALLVIPAIAISICAGFLRNSTSGIQGSIYVVYLTQIGIGGTVLGILFAAVEAASGLGSLFAGRVAHRVPAFMMLIGSTAAAIALIAVTPLLGGVVVLLVAAQVLRGLIQGVSLPLMFSVQAKAAPSDRQGATVALRVTFNRICSIIVPPVMGFIADRVGIGDSFLILGAVLISTTGILWLFARRLPADAVRQ